MIEIGKGKIAYGCSSNLNFRNMPSRHAEMDALNKIRTWKAMPKKIDMLVVRFLRNGELSESRPCFHCIETLEKSGINIRYIYYSTKDGNIIRENFNKMKNSPLTYISSGVKNRNKK